MSRRQSATGVWWASHAQIGSWTGIQLVRVFRPLVLISETDPVKSHCPISAPSRTQSHPGAVSVRSISYPQNAAGAMDQMYFAPSFGLDSTRASVRPRSHDGGIVDSLQVVPHRFGPP